MFRFKMKPNITAEHVRITVIRIAIDALVAPRLRTSSMATTAATNSPSERTVAVAEISGHAWRIFMRPPPGKESGGGCVSKVGRRCPEIRRGMHSSPRIFPWIPTSFRTLVQ